MWHRRPHHPCRRLLELLGVVPLGGWRREAAEEEEGRRQGRQLGVRGHDTLDSGLTSCRLVFELCIWRRHHHAAETFSWCLLPPVARLGAPFALFASLACLLKRGTREGLRAPYLFLICKPLGLSCI